MRQVPRKNYLILGFTAIGVVLICFLFSNMYKKKDGGIYPSIVKEVVSGEIKYEDIDNYLQENPDVVFYVYDSTRRNDKGVEKNFKSLILDNDISSYIV